MRVKIQTILFKAGKALAYGAAGAAVASITPESVSAALVAAGVPQQYVAQIVLVLTAAFGHAAHNIYDQKKLA